MSMTCREAGRDSISLSRVPAPKVSLAAGLDFSAANRGT
jgi:hypothetical protein